MKCPNIKKRLVIIALASVIFGVICYFFQRVFDGKTDMETFIAYRGQSNALLGKAEWVSFDMYWEQYYQEDTLWTIPYHVTLQYAHNQEMVFVDDPIHYKYFRITKSSADIIDYGDNKIVTYKKKLGGRYTSMGLQQHLANYIQYLWFYMMPFDNCFAEQSSFILKSYEVVSNGKDTVRKYVGKGRMGYIIIDSTRKKIMPKVYSFVNNNTNTMDSLRIRYIVDGEVYSQRIIRINNLCYNNRKQYIDSVFNLNSPHYARFSHHDEKNPENPWTDNHEINDKVLQFPLVNLSGDTTTLAENDGWVLLNVWSNNCAPCLENLLYYGHENDSLGYRIIEHEGIKIMAVNQSSDNMELICHIGEKTGTTDLMYSGKGLSGVIELRYFGYYYLISPDKQIVYETNNLGDYSELLKAKANYEKQHENK